MRKKFNLTDLDCANCAAKLEEGIRKINGVKEVSISFMTQKMQLDIEEEQAEQVLAEVQKTIKKIEPDVTIEEK